MSVISSPVLYLSVKAKNLDTFTERLFGCLSLLYWKSVPVSPYFFANVRRVVFYIGLLAFWFMRITCWPSFLFHCRRSRHHSKSFSRIRPLRTFQRMVGISLVFLFAESCWARLSFPWRFSLFAYAGFMKTTLAYDFRRFLGGWGSSRLLNHQYRYPLCF